MSHFIHSHAYVQILKACIFPFYWQRVQICDMGDKSKAVALVLSRF